MLLRVVIVSSECLTRYKSGVFLGKVRQVSSRLPSTVASIART